MKNLIVGLTLLVSMSSFASTVCDISILNIYTDNKLNLDEINSIKSTLSEKGYNVENLDNQNYLNYRRTFDLIQNDSSLTAGVVISMGIERDAGYFVSDNIIVDTYRRLTPKARRLTEVSNCTNIVKQSERFIYGHLCDKPTVAEYKTTLDDFTSKSHEHDMEVIEWSLKNIKDCK